MPWHIFRLNRVNITIVITALVLKVLLKTNLLIYLSKNFGSSLKLSCIKMLETEKRKTSYRSQIIKKQHCLILCRKMILLVFELS